MIESNISRKHSTFYAPPDFFRLPLCPHSQTQLVGPPASVHTVELYSHELEIASPPLTSSALAVFFLAKDPAMPRCAAVKPENRGPDRCPSEVFDNDWSRLVSCYDPYSKGTALRGELFSTGILSGCWEGRILVSFVTCFFFLFVKSTL